LRYLPPERCWVELLVFRCEHLLHSIGDVRVKHCPLVRGLCLVVAPGDFGTVSLFGRKGHHRLEVVTVQPQHTVEAVQQVCLVLRVVSCVSHGHPYQRPVLLFDVAGIVLLVGTRPCESDAVGAAEPDHMVVDEL